MRPRGFTLIELVVVLAVIAALAAMVVPRLPLFGQRDRLNSAARLIIAAARLARSEAVTRARPASLLVVGEPGAVKVQVEDEEVWTGPLGSGIKLKGLAVRGAAPGQEAVINFRPDGRASEAVIHLESEGGELTLHLEPLTGQVVVHEGLVEYDWTG